MENKNIEDCEIQSKATIRFSPSEEKEYYVGLRSQLIKILYLIEDEKAGKGSAELYIYGFMYELKLDCTVEVATTLTALLAILTVAVLGPSVPLPNTADELYPALISDGIPDPLL